MDALTNKKMEDWSVFILREISEDGVETNTILGGFYSLVLKSKSKERFDLITAEWAKSVDFPGIYGVVTFFDKSIMPLFENCVYYIMTDTGSTVSNISKKL